MTTVAPIAVSNGFQKKADALVARFPHKQSATLPLLWLCQETYGNITPEVMAYVADQCEVSSAHVYGLYTFYTLYRRSDDGTHVLHVCSTLPCALRGSEAIVDHIRERLGIEVGETTSCGTVTLRKAECLAGCDKAPIIQVDLDYHENLTIEAVDAILDELLPENGKEEA